MEERKMAQNWTLKEAVEKVLAGDKEAILDIGKRFPLTATAIAAMGKNEGALTIINALPDHMTARKVEMALKDGIEENTDEEAEDSEEEEEKPAKKSSDEKKKERAAARKAKREAAKKAKEQEEEVEEDEEDEEESGEKDYSELTAPELFKMCKARKIKVEPKQKASVYIKALKEADAAVEEEYEDDWEEEPEEKPAPKKSKEKAEKKSKPSAKAKKEEDEDDDWDI